jgi:hypothetical protein
MGLLRPSLRKDEAIPWVNEEGLAMTWNERGKDDATDVIALKIA